MSGPVIRLQCLSPEDLLILLSNIRHVVSGGDVSKYLVPDDALLAFMATVRNASARPISARHATRSRGS